MLYTFPFICRHYCWAVLLGIQVSHLDAILRDTQHLEDAEQGRLLVVILQGALGLES